MVDTPPTWVRALHHLVRLSAVAALAALIAEFGFHLQPRQVQSLERVQLGVTALIALDALVRLAVAKDRRAHLAAHRLETLLVAAFMVQVAVSLILGRGVDAESPIVLGAQVYLVLVVGLALARANEHLLYARVRPELLLLASFVLVIAVGTGLFLLPKCQALGAEPWTWVDALFTSTSAVCVTGLSVRDIGGDLSLRGQAVLLALIQIGGLGLVAIAAAVSVFQHSSTRMREHGTLHTLFGVDDLGTLRSFLRYVLAITIAAELAGCALLVRAADGPGSEIGARLWWACFHSVSAFCNAGFSLDATSLAGRALEPGVVLVIAALIAAGGLGFPVWIELLRYRVGGLSILRRVRSRWFGALGSTTPRLSLHARLTLATVAALIVGGAVLFWAAEREGALAPLGALDGAVNALFQSITARTAGFNTLDVASFSVQAIMLMIVLMAIGASPVSTGGGIKTSAIAVVFHTIRAMVKNREHVEAFGRSIARRVINASVTVVTLYTLAVLVVATALLVVQPGLDALDVLFESVSALSTVGLSIGVTAKLDTPGRVILCAAMLVGRVGPIALLWTLFARPPGVRYEYPSEKIVVT